MAKALVEIVGDAESFVLSLRESIGSVSTFKRELGSLNVDVKKSAETQVRASMLRTSRIREEIAAIQKVSSAYKRGSEEQIAAMNLVARKQAELARITGTSGVGYGRSSRGNVRREERQASSLVRGGLRGSGIGGLGLSALAGGAFFGSFIATGAIRTTITAATNALAIEKQLAAQYKASGQNLADYRGQISQTLDKLSALSGFNKDDLTQSYIGIFRAAGDTSKALKDEAIAADVARGRHMDLQAASLLVAKVINGNVGLLKRYGIETWKGETATQALAAIQQKYAGQAQAGATAQERFSAMLHNSEVIIGTALLPTVNHLLSSGARWLDQMNRSGKLQRDVNTAVRDAGIVVRLLRSGFQLLSAAIRTANRLTGGFKHTLELLIGLKVASMLTGWTGPMGRFGTKTGTAETNASKLRGTLGSLAKIGAITVGIDLLVNAKGNGVGLLEQSLGGALVGGSILGIPGAIGGALAVPLAKGSYALGHDLRGPLGLNTPAAQRSRVPAKYSDSADSREAYLSGLNGSGYPFQLGDPTHLKYLAVYEAGRKARQAQTRSNRRTGATTPARPGPIHEFALPTNIQNALAGALTPAQDKKAAQDALAYTQKLISSGRLVGQAYTDALKERRKLYSQIARDVKKLTGTGGTGGSLLPVGVQESLAKAQGDAASKSLPALRALEGEQRKALAVLRAQHDTGAARLKQLKEETALERQLAATQKQIVKAQTDAQKAADAATARRILRIGGPKAKPSAVQSVQAAERKTLNEALAELLAADQGAVNELQRRRSRRVSPNRGLGRVPRAGSTQARALAVDELTRRTARLNLEGLTQLVRKEFGDKIPKSTLESLNKINQVLKLKFLPPDVLANLRARLAQIKATLAGGLAGISQTASGYKGVSAQEFVKGIPGLTKAQRLALEEKYSQVQAHGGVATGPAALGVVTQAAPGQVHINGPVHVHGVQNLDQLISDIEKRTRHKVQRGSVRR